MLLISDYKSEKKSEAIVKKIVLILLVLFVLGGTAAFAEHPSGLGIGVVGGGGGWNGGGGANFGLSLKVPSVPIFWGINITPGGNFLGLGVTGDSYLIDDTLLGTDALDLGWFLGVGGIAHLGLGDNYFGLDIGARLPIGLSLQISIIEVFLDVAPTIGLAIVPRLGLYWDAPVELGVRIWL
jgi:hypothetical protein